MGAAQPVVPGKRENAPSAAGGPSLLRRVKLGECLKMVSFGLCLDLGKEAFSKRVGEQPPHFLEQYAAFEFK